MSAFGEAVETIRRYVERVAQLEKRVADAEAQLEAIRNAAIPSAEWGQWSGHPQAKEVIADRDTLRIQNGLLARELADADARAQALAKLLANAHAAGLEEALGVVAREEDRIGALDVSTLFALRLVKDEITARAAQATVARTGPTVGVRVQASAAEAHEARQLLGLEPPTSDRSSRECAAECPACTTADQCAAEPANCTGGSCRHPEHDNLADPEGA